MGKYRDMDSYSSPLILNSDRNLYDADSSVSGARQRPRAFVDSALGKDIEKMVANFGSMGVVIAMPDPRDMAGDIPPVLLVEHHKLPSEIDNSVKGIKPQGAASDSEKGILEGACGDL